MNVTATATAALTGQSTTVPGELQLPVGISDCNFLDPAKGCGTEITFSPTGTSCSAWTTFDLAPNHNPNPVILLDIVDGDLESNAYVTNLDKFDFTGGDLGNNITHLICLYRDIGYDVTADDKYICKVKTFDPLNPEYVPCDDINADGVPLNYIDDPNIPVGIGPDDPPDPNAVAVPLFEPDGDRAYYPYVDEFPDQDQTLYNKFNERPRNKHIWDTTVAVYKEPADCDSCGNPNAELEIVGFARIRVTSILGPPYDTLVGVTDCGYVDNDDSRGGGGEIFGLIGSIPGLVQ